MISACGLACRQKPPNRLRNIINIKVEHGGRKLAALGCKFNISKADRVFSNDNRILFWTAADLENKSDSSRTSSIDNVCTRPWEDGCQNRLKRRGYETSLHIGGGRIVADSIRRLSLRDFREFANNTCQSMEC
jgi:hypothetical protein